jgi:penicillin-binding protein 1C
VTVPALLHSVPTTPCPYHHVYEVDRVTGRAVLPACRVAGHDYAKKTFTMLPSSVSGWLRDRNRGVPEAPVFADSCVGEQTHPPVMVTPSENQVVTLIPGVPAKQQSIPLSASTRAATVSWFVDGALIATVPATERAYWVPTAGKHDIVVADEAGRKARRTLDVQLANQLATH